MYQLHYEYHDEDSLRGFLSELDARMNKEGSTTLLVHVFIDSCDLAYGDVVVNALEDIIPSALYVIATTSGNIASGKYVYSDTPTVTIVCDVFEDEKTKVEILHFPFDYETQDATVDALDAAVRERTWVTAIEALTTIVDADVPAFCRKVSCIPDHIAWFGGCVTGPQSSDLYSARPYVRSSAKGATHRGAAFVLYGGENLHVMMQASVGWKPLGRPLRVTSADHSLLRELDGMPAYDVYHHYLQIDKHDHFFSHSVLFPLAFDYDGLLVLKTPVHANDDGSLIMTSDISDTHRECRIAYGNPTVILKDIESNAREMRQFAPQSIRAFSCAGRKVYWGDEYVSRETTPFNTLAPTAGFYTGGEFMRYRGEVVYLNITLVTAALREGDAIQESVPEPQVETQEFIRHMALVQSLTTFVGIATDELEEVFRKLELMAITDGLTNIYNRTEIERRIERAALDYREGLIQIPPIAIMLDIDNFKKINDTYGHKAGDNVLKAIGPLFKECIGICELEGDVGRWGGEEFMILLKDCDIDAAHELAELIRERFALIKFEGMDQCTISLGIVKARQDESAEAFCMRVDNALYRAKAMGKNRVIVE